MIKIDLSSIKQDNNIAISGSKSESNRLLVLRQVSGGCLEIENLSDSKDTCLMKGALETSSETVDVGAAGTVMRFSTAYYACLAGRKVILKGTLRMHQRPIAPLVDALRRLGADIRYLENEGFPPLEICGKRLKGGKTSISAEVSSQFITALILVSPLFEEGLELVLEGKAVSAPYIRMTLSLLERCGIKSCFEDNAIKIFPGQRFKTDSLTVESDWSSASYYYSYCAAAPYPIRIALTSFRPDSLQGDSILQKIYRDHFGVESSFENRTLVLTPAEDFSPSPDPIQIDMESSPDIAQTVAVTMAIRKIRGKLTGLKTLRVKETDRIEALRKELEKFGVRVSADDSSLEITGFTEPEKDIVLETYDDHRMAMAFAPFALIHPFVVKNPEVVDKSYPAFWEDFQKSGGVIEPVGPSGK